MQNICIYGIGGVGGYFGGKIAYGVQQRHEKRHVSFIARGEHLAAIQQNGLHLQSSEQPEMRCVPDLATASLADVPTPDVCIICVKGYDLDAAAASLAPYIKDSTIILPLLNGVDIYERVRRQINNGVVLPACVYIRSYIDAPGTVVEAGSGGKIICGPDPQAPDFNPQPLLDLCKQMQIHCVWAEHPATAIWEKYLFIAAFALMTAFSGKTLGQVMEDEELAATTREIIREIYAIACRQGVTLPQDAVESAFRKGRIFPYDTTTSYQRDVMAKRAKNEGDLFGGTILRLGDTLGVATPATARIYAAIEATF